MLSLGPILSSPSRGGKTVQNWILSMDLDSNTLIVPFVGSNHCSVSCTHSPFVKRFRYCLGNYLNCFSISVYFCKFSFSTSRFCCICHELSHFIHFAGHRGSSFLTGISYMLFFLVSNSDIFSFLSESAGNAAGESVALPSILKLKNWKVF